MAQKISVSDIINSQRKHAEEMIQIGYPRSDEWVREAFAGAQQILGIDEKLMPRWEWVEQNDMCGDDDDDDKITLGRFVPMEGNILLNKMLFYYGTRDVIQHVVFHEMSHLAHMISILSTKSNSSRGRKFVRWCTDEQYAHGAAFKKFMKLCEYQDDVVFAWFNILDERKLINF